MKVQERWKQEMAKKEIEFKWNILKGKFPHEAEMVFQDGEKISMRGRRMANEYHVIASEVGSGRKSQEKLPYFSLLIDFFKEFLQNKEEVDTLLIRDFPFGDNQEVVKQHHLIYFSQMTSEKMKKQGMLQFDYAFYYVPFKENLIEQMKRVLASIDHWGEKEEKNHDLFYVKHYTTLTSPQLNYHYAGHNGLIKFDIEKEKLTIYEETLMFSHTCSIDNMHEGLSLLIEKLVKKQKLRSMFRKETFYLDHYLYQFNFYGMMGKKIKEFLLGKLSIQEIEIRAARCVKENVAQRRQSVVENNVQLVNVIGFHLVSEDLEIIFCSENLEEALTFYENKLIEKLEKSVAEQKKRIALAKANYVL